MTGENLCFILNQISWSILFPGVLKFESEDV